MLIEVYMNEGPGMFRGYTPADRLRKAAEFNGMLVDGDSDDALLEAVFLMLGNNVDASKPDGYRDRSLSVADVVTLTDADGARSYAVAGVGFDRLADTITGGEIVTFEQEYARRIEAGL